MEMEGVFARVVVVDDDVNDLALVEDKSVGVGGVYFWLHGAFAGTEGAVESGHFRADVGDVVEGSADWGS